MNSRALRRGKFGCAEVADRSTSPRESRSERRLPTLGCAAIVYLTFGGNFLGFRIAVDTVPPFLATTVRGLLGGLLLLVIRALVRRASGAPPNSPITTAQMRASAVQAILLLVCGQASVAWSVQQLPAGTAAILASSMPIWVALLSVVWLRHPLSRTGVLGVMIGFAGLVALSFAREGGGLGVNGEMIVPALVVLAGALATAAGVLYGRRAAGPPDGLLGSALQMICAGLILGCLALATGEAQAFTLAAVSTRSWAALAYLVIFGSVIGYSALVMLTEHAASTIDASFAYVAPIVALVLSALLLNEHIGVAKVAAASLALAGAALMAREGPSSGGAKGDARPCCGTGSTAAAGSR